MSGNIVFKLLLSSVFIMVVGYCLMYNHKVLSIFEKYQGRLGEWFFTKFGLKLRTLNRKVEKVSNLKKGSLQYKVVNFYRDMIVNLDMEKDNVTPIGLVIFIASISLGVAIFIIGLIGGVVLLPPMFLAIFFLITVIFKFSALVRSEQREMEIMDAEDMLVSDISEGVQNSIQRYKDMFHPNIRPYFIEFLDDINFKGYGFKNAMVKLNEKLGNNFSNFSHKAIMYEEKADKEMTDIFSTIIEVNRHKRTLRAKNNEKFAQLRQSLIISVVMIAGYCLFTITTDPFLQRFFVNSYIGKFLLILDIVAVTGVLAFIASIKAKSL